MRIPVTVTISHLTGHVLLALWGGVMVAITHGTFWELRHG